MSEGNTKPVHCTECGARGAGEDWLCKPCYIGEEHASGVPRKYFQDLDRKGGQAVQAKRGHHRLDVPCRP